MAIQFKRGSYSNKVASTEILKAGQPFFEKTYKKLYIGDGSTQLKNLAAINDTDTNQVTIAMNGGLEYSKGNDIKLKATTTTKTGTNEYNL